MFLYHYSNVDTIESILEKGMIFGSEIKDSNYGYGTGPINGVLERHKPTHLPDFIHRDRCIFFYPTCHYGSRQETEIKVDPASLNQEKLYVADLTYAQQIWEDTVHASHSGQCSTVPLAKSAENYWNSLVPLATYLQNPQSIASPEVLYFGKIPFNVLEISTTLHPLGQTLVHFIGKSYEVTRSDVLTMKVYVTKTQYVTLHVSLRFDALIVASKTGHIDKSFLKLLEQTITYHQKRIEKNGHHMRVTYQNVR